MRIVIIMLIPFLGVIVRFEIYELIFLIVVETQSR